MRSLLALCMCLGLLLLVTPVARAESTVHGFNLPTVDGDKGESFTLRFEIRSDETTNYTIKLTPRDEFEWTSGNELSINIPQNDTRTFKFEGRLAKALEADGKYNLQWEAYQNGTKFDSGSVDLRVGEQAPGLGLAWGLAAVAGLAVMTRRRR